MRSLFILSSAILLSACAGQQAVPEKSAPAPAAAPVAAPAPVAAAPVEKKAPQCYSGDAGAFGLPWSYAALRAVRGPDPRRGPGAASLPRARREDLYRPG